MKSPGYALGEISDPPYGLSGGLDGAQLAHDKSAISAAFHASFPLNGGSLREGRREQPGRTRH